MGFFSDLKEDLSQAVDELMPNEGGAAGGNHMMTQEEIMAAFAAAAEEPEAQPVEETAADEGQSGDLSDISLEEMLKNIDSIAFPEMEEPVAETSGTAVEDFGAEPAVNADMDMSVGVTEEGTAPDSQSLEEMLAAAIAALPEQEEPVAEGFAAEESVLCAAEETPEDVAVEVAEEVPGEIAEAGDMEAAEPQLVGEQPETLPEEEGVTAYESLVQGEVVSDELVIDEPVFEETPAVDSFRAELMADIPLFDETLRETSKAAVPEETATESVVNATPVIADAAPAAAQESDIEKMSREMTYVADGASVIAVGMHICGDLLADAPVSVMGTIEGNVEVNGKLSVGGQIHGNIRAAEIYAEGAKLTGDIVSEGAVKLGAKSVVLGNILANSAAIAGAVKGDIDVHGPIILDSTAIVVGNIKFKSIQINNGAVIEGMCLQCYADINPTSFFDAV